MNDIESHALINKLEGIGFEMALANQLKAIEILQTHGASGASEENYKFIKRIARGETA